ncbi:nucleoside deaminase [Membranihabitans marinus]
MKQALIQAEMAYDINEIPIGAVVTYQDRIVARAYNQVEMLNDVTAHAEILAITTAANTLGSKYLVDCSLYVTLEPCFMCAGALHWSRASRIIVGASDPKKGFSLYNPPILYDTIEVTYGILESECSELLQSFFKNKR